MPSLEWKTDLNHGPVLLVSGRFAASGVNMAAAAGNRFFLYSSDGGEYREEVIYDAGEEVRGMAVLRAGFATEGLLVSTSGSIWLIGMVKGEFSPIQRLHPQPGTSIICLATGDLDGDGRDEIIAATTQPDAIYVYKIKGRGFSGLQLEPAGFTRTPGTPRLLGVVSGTGHNTVLAACEKEGSGGIARYIIDDKGLLGGMVLEGHPPGITTMVSGNFGLGKGSQMAVGSVGGLVWLMGSGQIPEIVRVTQSLGATVSVLAALDIRNGGLMAGTPEGNVFIFNNPVQQKPDLEFSPVEGVSGLAALPGGRVAVGTVTGGLQVWSLSSGVINSGYIVKPGDTLKKISGAFGVSVEVLLSLNENIKNPDVILPGQMIKIPVTAKEKF